MDANRLPWFLNSGLGSQEMVTLMLFIHIFLLIMLLSKYRGGTAKNRPNVDKLYCGSLLKSPVLAPAFVLASACCLLVCSACRCQLHSQTERSSFDCQTKGW